MTKTIDRTIILYCLESLPANSLDAYMVECDQLILTGPGVTNTSPLPNNTIIAVSEAPQKGKVSFLNEAVRRADGSHILWLNQGESIPFIPVFENSYFYAARIANTEAAGPVYNWQVRLFPNPKNLNNIFAGVEIPDIQQSINRTGWQRSDRFLTIHGSGPLVSESAIAKELQHDNPSPMRAFWYAMLAAEDEDYNRAIEGFKQALQSTGLFLWNHLAVLNSLANVLMEAQHAEQARALAEKSLNLSHDQWAPYLTLHQYYNLKGQWEQAYQQLQLYRSASRKGSAANWDAYLPEAEAAFLMAEIAFGKGNHEKAYKHYQEFYAFNGGNISAAILEKLLIYAIELDDKMQAIAYFKALFGDDVSVIANKNESARLLEALSMFTDKGWYDFPSTVYRHLVEHHPEDNAIRHGCIRTLVKNDELEKAQAML